MGEEQGDERIMTPTVAMSSGRSQITFELFYLQFVLCPLSPYPIPSTIPKEDCIHAGQNAVYFGPKIQVVVQTKTLCVDTYAAMSFCDSDRHTSMLPCAVSLPADSVWLLMEQANVLNIHRHWLRAWKPRTV